MRRLKQWQENEQFLPAVYSPALGRFDSPELDAAYRCRWQQGSRIHMSRDRTGLRTADVRVVKARKLLLLKPDTQRLMMKFRCVVPHCIGHYESAHNLPLAHLFAQISVAQAVKPLVLMLVFCCCMTNGARVDPDEDLLATTDLTLLPPERLLEIEVYSPSKRAEKLSQTSAAITVLTQDDIA